jgi:NADH pyrophosphatase NudC (nudix superfamily)
MSSHGDQILFEILEELRELKEFLMPKPFPTTLQELEDEVAAEKAKAKTCADCGCDLNEGEAKTFTVCDDCWDKHYPR